MVKVPNRQTKKINLEKIEGGEVEVYTSLTAGDVQEINESNSKSILTPLKLLIKSWNLENEEGKPLEITEENLKIIDVNDVNKIVDTSGINMNSYLRKNPVKKNG